ncbi:hypothetical protein CHOED_07 [Vibrio phage CHOED]|uniref:hypothetical protein n=1 Tax=Vibrio phage CHOED TaxID=1458716 RepID=UPI00042E5D06|nr:hypothetical protein CHOED_07 [Vibrio phage CHOED]AHK11867.1 hypothetical protein CHOED_07 [Vibrio phage CHOED]
MAYNVTPGTIVNGRIIDAVDLLNEFTAISIASKDAESKIEDAKAAAIQDSKTYTDTTLAAETIIDGGTF